MNIASRMIAQLWRLPPAVCTDIVEESGIRIAMRDGVELVMDRFSPQGGDGLPVILIRSRTAVAICFTTSLLCWRNAVFKCYFRVAGERGVRTGFFGLRSMRNKMAPTPLIGSVVNLGIAASWHLWERATRARAPAVFQSRYRSRHCK